MSFSYNYLYIVTVGSGPGKKVGSGSTTLDGSCSANEKSV